MEHLGLGDLRVQVLHPRPGGRMTEPDPTSADVFVVNYAQLRRRADFYTKTHWLAVILDEGQNIKNPDSQSARTVRAMIPIGMTDIVTAGRMI